MEVRLPGLRATRDRLLLTQAEVAEKTSLAPETISRIESGRPVRAATARRIALKLGVPVESLRAPVGDQPQSISR
jgi:transcriptional regulator with XRE-family HTH domain